MNRSIIVSYLNAFRKAISIYIREGVGMKSVVYPFDGGAVVVFELGENIKTSDEFRNDSKEFAEALRRTNLFSVDANTTAPVGSFIAPLGNSIVLVKDDKVETWDIEQATTDVRQLLSKIKSHV